MLKKKSPISRKANLRLTKWLFISLKAMKTGMCYCRLRLCTKARCDVSRFLKPPYPAESAHCCFHKPCVTSNDHLSFLYRLVTFPCRISSKKCFSNVVNVVRNVTNSNFTTLG
ncbi:hypothetical protein NPIL_120881 [Nephila pilipes]|uniref:Uncharacterized protein n=1 Tax=Nephila pilipes TaxID=299642 RepID=A0A8X6PUH6_NEPPI|nr:hypothetical protein NPIL_120881 [Nephila pilipes]